MAKIDGNTITFTKPLKHDHPANDIVTVEFVRYRWWVDSDLGTVFWHDHAFGATTWPHGGFGSVIIAPQGSTYHDPKTGKQIRSGPIADIHTVEPVGYGVNGSFRELMVSIHDTVPHTVNLIQAGNPPGQPIDVALEGGKTVSFQMPDKIPMLPNAYVNGGTHTTGSGLNFRAEPFARRLANNPDTTKLFSSLAHRDPDTPLLRAYLGDTVVFRLLHQLMNESHVWTVSGHTFLTERYAGDANRKNSIHIGIAERYDLVTKAGGFQGMPGDYIHFNGRASHFAEGGWGIVRVLDKELPDLKRLPAGTRKDEIPTAPASVCPDSAPVKTFNVVALDRPLNFNPKSKGAIEVDFERKIEVANPEGKIFVLEEEATRVATGLQPNPLTLRVNLGDCIKVNLKNKMANSRASFFAPGLGFDPRDSQGINVGNNAGDQTIASGQSRTYTYYAHPSNKETTSLVWDGANVVSNPRNGLFGVEGHEWPIEPYMAGADMISVVEFAGSEVLDAFLREGAGGPYRLAGDYVWSNQRLPYSQSGQWGYLRVLPAGDQRILPLSSGVVGGQKAQIELAPPIAMPISGTSAEAQTVK